MTEEQTSPEDLPPTKEKGEESYDPSKSSSIKKNQKKPIELPSTHVMHEGASFD